MTTLYFVRHAKVKFIEDDYNRPLSNKGKADILKVTKIFKDIKIDKLVSSPYLRAKHTIQGVADEKKLNIDCYNDLRERKVAHGFIDDFESFVRKQWENFDYKLEGGESLSEVQKRGNKVIRYLSDIYKDKSIIIGTHGTFLAVHLNYYNSKYDFEFWKGMKMPDIYKLQYNDDRLINIENLKV